MHIGQRGQLKHQRLGATRRSGQRTGDHKGQQLEGVCVIAQRCGAVRVLADGFEDLAKRRVDDTPNQQKAQQEDGQHKNVHVEVVFEVDPAKQLAARHRLDAVFAPRKGRLQTEKEHHLRQRQRDHGEVNALALDRQQAHHQGQYRRSHSAQQHTQLRVQAPHLGRMRRHVTGQAHEHGVAKRQQATKAQQQIEGAGKQGKAHHLHQKHGVDPHRGHRQDGRHQPKRDPQVLLGLGRNRVRNRLGHGFTSVCRTDRQA